MGILNLHKFLERCSTKNNLSSLRGQVVGVDAMCWLHRGSVASAWELLTGRDTDKFLRFFVKMLVLCNVCGVKPIIVFDGASLPAKAKEESERRQRRAENSQKAKEEIESRKITSLGQVDNKLRSMIVQSVSITAEMITRTMSVLRRLNVDFVVAPYEADAQLAFMYRQGIVAGVVSEDSDLIAFGCHRLLAKMDTNGDFVDVRVDWAFRGPDLPTKPSNLGELGKLERWTESMFVDLCILSGSDYKLGKITGIGIKKAFQLLNRHRGIQRIVDEISRAKKWTKEEREKFVSDFYYAKIAFQKHRVFDLKTERCVTITDNVVEDREDHEVDAIIGPEMDPDRAKLVLTGEIDAKSGEKRFFLDRLPPGVLGIYNNSLKQGDAQPTPASELSEDKKRELSQYEQLEMQIVADFERHGAFKRQDVIESNRQSYLSKLEGMILSSSAIAAPLPRPTVEDEFGDLDALLQLDEDFCTTKTEDKDDLIDLDVEAGEAEEKPPAPPAPVSKVKNPFAKPEQQENKKPRQSQPPMPVTASVIPHMKSEKRNSSGDTVTLTDVLNQSNRRSSAGANDKPQFVSTREIVTQAPIRNFFSRK